MTCLSSLWNFRYPGGFLGLGFFPSTALSFGSDITRSPDSSDIPRQALSSDRVQYFLKALRVRIVTLVIAE
jgi:hypothetical protein